MRTKIIQPKGKTGSSLNHEITNVPRGKGQNDSGTL
jgi:hypothetical protein